MLLMRGMLLPHRKLSSGLPEANRKMQEAKSVDRARLAALSREQLLEMDRRDQAIFDAAFGKFPHAK